MGPDTIVLGEEARKNGLGQSLLRRLHTLYQSHGYSNGAVMYTASLLSNWRSHRDIVKLVSKLFYRGTLQVHCCVHSCMHAYSDTIIDTIIIIIIIIIILVFLLLPQRAGSLQVHHLHTDNYAHSTCLLNAYLLKAVHFYLALLL